MEKITRKDILEKALSIYSYERSGGICPLLTEAMIDITNDQCPIFVKLTNRDQRKIIPKFRRIYAILFFHASISGCWWWDMGIWKEEDRLGFLRWLYDQYKNDTEDISSLIIKPCDESDK